MNSRRLCIGLIATGLVMVTACRSALSVPKSAFQALESADHVDITTSSKQVRTIVQPWRIRKTALILGRYAEGWRRPISGTPLSGLVIGFRKAQNLLGRFGIGKDFITMGEDLLWCQPLNTKDRKELLACLAIEERTLPPQKIIENL